MSGNVIVNFGGLGTVFIKNPEIAIVLAPINFNSKRYNTLLIF